jgi:hypothetical protein
VKVKKFHPSVILFHAKLGQTLANGERMIIPQSNMKRLISAMSTDGSRFIFFPYFQLFVLNDEYQDIQMTPWFQ